MFKNSSIENTLRVKIEYTSTKFDLKIKKRKKVKTTMLIIFFLNFF